MTRRQAIAILGVLLLVGAGAALVYAWGIKNEQVQATTLTYADAAYGITFEYPSSYALTEEELGTSARYYHRIQLEPATTSTAQIPSETPPSITVEVFQNDTDRMAVEEWIRSATSSNFSLSNGELASTSIDGVEGLSYTWDGLYRGESIVVSHRDSIIVFTVTSIAPADEIRTDFRALLDTVQLLKEGELVPEPRTSSAPPVKPNTIACTMEAKLCPDGSYVGRSGPKCEFSVCPTSDSAATVTARLGESVNGLGVKLVPLEVVEDSRCPLSVQCIQAGTVRVRTQAGSDEYAPITVFVLGEAQIIQGKSVTLTDVFPAQETPGTIPPSSYSFTFSIVSQ